jgi:predicted 2-oxoglutarate/Fe(II)-dependent dioxygenase YbiX
MTKMADSTDLKDYVQVYQNLLAPETCEQIIEWAEQQGEAESPWDGWEVAKTAVSNDVNIVTTDRKCHYTMMNEHRGVCVDNINSAIKHVQKSYPYLHKCTEHTGIQIMRYQVGHYFKEHIDAYTAGPRTLTLDIKLNDKFEGGALTFWQDKHQFRYLCTGDAVVFPSSFLYPHEVHPVTKGVRYQCIMWMQ